MVFHRFLAAVLADAGILTQVLSASEMPEPSRQRWFANPGFEGACLVAASSDEQAVKIMLEYTVQNCKICFHCDELFVRPGEIVCPECAGVLDPRHPDEIRAQYERDCRGATEPSS